MKVEESLNMTFDKSPPPTKLSPLVDDDVGEEEAIKNNTKVIYNNNEDDESIEVDEVVNIKESNNDPLDQVIGNLNQRTLRSQAQNHNVKEVRLEDSKPTKTSMSTEIKLNKDDEADSVDSSKYRGLESFLTLNEPICPRFVVEFYHSLEVKRDEEEHPYIEQLYISKWSLNSLDDHLNSNFFGPKHDLVKNNITVSKTTQTHLQRSPNKLYIDDIGPDLRGWELFFRENFFCSLGKRNKVNACTAYMFYYLIIRRKFNFTLMIIYQMEEVINKRDGPMPFAMLLTRLYNHILLTKLQTIVQTARFKFHECVRDPLHISRNPRKEKGKKFSSPPVTSSSSSSSDDNEAPSFLEFCDKLSDNEDLTKAQ
ncbi:hypothetical protein Tco_0470833 [Tanacetum coccineum]